MIDGIQKIFDKNKSKQKKVEKNKMKRDFAINSKPDM